ncbi:hypothetical protein RirG_003890 [Rhizophagus irregularis DAOM 197198w]|uniref:Uncharacterized protein n=1 Tax=Rhizophagus irregularis (strain DAOM 197198w) TaxID=1432141 RepID=A0A015KCW0_RHIIW|nr:hypothetical protein RirG_003890 [Rhizophagus irregularis DAOM 197198w]
MKRTYHPTQDFRQNIIPAKTRVFEYEADDISSSVSHIQKFEDLNEALSNIKVENTTSSRVKEKSNVLDAKMDIDDISSFDVKGDDMMNIDSLSNQQTIPNEHEVWHL